jgi:hypothetical protein
LLVVMIPVAIAKARVVEAIRGGASVVAATAAVDRQPKTYEMWRRDDKAFASKVDQARKDARKLSEQRDLIAHDPEQQAVMRAGANGPKIPFTQWRKRYLGYDTYPHQQQWVDVLEGNEPVPIEGCEWDRRSMRRVVVNVPPAHAKSTVLTVDYVTYRICMDPNVRVVIVCKRKEMAQAFLYQIKQRLTSSVYAPLQEAYAPPGGWRPASGEGSFTQNLMYLTGRTADYKDPTVQAIGLRTQIYGARADLVILDDCIVLDNANEFDKQIQWLESEVVSRVKNGQVLVVGTRLASADLYSELRNDDRYLSGKSPWSHLRQPMVLQFADDPADWKTLWPKSSSPSDALDEPGPDGLYDAWPGPKAAEIRDSVPPSVWSLVYQQQQTASDASFTPEMVRACTDRRRKPGPLVAGALGHPATGGEGMWTIASMDPAMAGDTFVLVGKVDRTSRARWVENAWVQGSPSPQWIRDKIRDVTLEYDVNEWVIEEQGFQGFLVHDPEINRFLASRGVRMHGTYTGKEKNDPDFGVASVAALFGTFERINEGAGRAVHRRDNLIHLPDPDQSQGIKTLNEELFTWVPGVRGSKLRQDGPMALWFFEQRARVWLGEGRSGASQTHMSIPFLSRAHQARQMTVPSTLRGFMR